MRAFRILFILAPFITSCTSTEGTPVDQSALGYLACEDYFDCGVGRYCTANSTCFTDCRSNADCALFGEGLVCNRFGQCLEPDGSARCESHADCGEGRYCNSTCSDSGAHCTTAEDCPYAGEECKGKCGAHCGKDDDCRERCVEERCSITNDRCAGDDECTRMNDQECTPVAQCLQPGWEKWIPLENRPPIRCTLDSHCKALGWRYVCDCEKERHRSGYYYCVGHKENECVEGELDFGDGPAGNPAHNFRGVWGMRMVIGSVTVGVPLVNKQNTYSTNLFLVKMSHEEGNIVKIDQKICEIELIN